MIKTLTSVQKQDRLRILELSYRHQLIHVGSCLTAVDAISAVYKIKKPKDKFILSSGHAGLALYVVLERLGIGDAEVLLKKHGTHPNRDEKNGLFCSSGSLGHGFAIALGMALANRRRNIYCMISDGETAEGGIWETLRVARDRQVRNLHLIVNANGYGAYCDIDYRYIVKGIRAFGWKINIVNGHNMQSLKKSLLYTCDKPVATIAHTKVNQVPFLNGLHAHYKKIQKDEYALACKLLI